MDLFSLLSNQGAPMPKIEYSHLITQQSTSGISALAFCKQHHIPYQNFIYHRKRFLQQSREALTSSSPFLEIVNTDSTNNADPQKHASLQFGGTSLFIPMSSSRQEWAQLLQALQITESC